MYINLLAFVLSLVIHFKDMDLSVVSNLSKFSCKISALILPYFFLPDENNNDDLELIYASSTTSSEDGFHQHWHALNQG